MTPDEFRRNRETLGLSQAQLADVFGVGKRTVGYWEDGSRPVNGVAVKMMEWLLTGDRPPQYPVPNRTRGRRPAA
jgi:DNA-binding transcriptional regulator YiaG